MIRRALFVVVVGVSAVAMLPHTAIAQEEEKAKAQKPQEDPMAAMMEALAKTAQPGENHAHLQPLIGSWKLNVKWRMEPESEYQVSESTAVLEWILGGRYVSEKVRGEVDGEPFEGRGFLGYDNLRKKFTSLWMDSMSTGTMFSYGTADESGKIITFSGEGINPMTGQTQKERMVIRVINNDKFISEMYQPGPDGKEFQSMEITYTRK